VKKAHWSFDDFGFEPVGDGIPQLYRIIFGSDFFKDNRRISNTNDGFSNKQAFLMGAVSSVDLTNVPDRLMVKTSSQPKESMPRVAPNIHFKSNSLPLFQH